VSVLSSVKGHFDDIQGDAVYGWCQTSPYDRIMVFCDGQLIGTVKPNIQRDDLASEGPGSFGFSCKIPHDLCDGEEHRVVCTSMLTGLELDGSGRSIITPDKGGRGRANGKHKPHGTPTDQAPAPTARGASASSILDAYVRTPPSVENALRLFEGQWSSILPGYGFGNADLFNDHRVRWFEERVGGLSGKRVLELGPLEGAHTYMMAERGASVLAIESNTRAYLKCLIVQSALKFDAQFMLGDFRPYLASGKDHFDLLVASGVLYHMTDPVALLRDMCRVSKAIGIWTHYYDPRVIEARPDLTKKFDKKPKLVDVNGRRLELYRQAYLAALEWGGFCGGADDHSYWMTLEGIESVFDACGFDVELGAVESIHPNGPCATLFARKR
jgi:SAM-dependent methyltransferase